MSLSQKKLLISAIIAAALLVLLGAFLGSRKPKPAPKRAFHPWIITTASPKSHNGAYLGNGFIAARLGNEGWGYMDGQPLPSFMSGLYSGETIAQLPHWSGVEIYGRRGRFRIDKDQPYRQSLDMRHGYLRTRYAMRSGRDVIDLDVLFFVSRLRAGIAIIRFIIKPKRDLEVRIESNPGKLSGLLIADRGGKTENIDVDSPTAPFFSARTADGSSRFSLASRLICPSAIKRLPEGSWEGRLKKDKPYTFTKFVIAAKDGRYGDPVRRARLTLKSALAIGFDNLFAEHKQAWLKLWQADIKIVGDPEAQQVVHSCMFYLLQSVRPGSEWSIPPTGLSSSAWNGHVFWDADTWMFPALLPQHPELAKSIVDYRYKTLSGARVNARKRGLTGVEYAWESARTGRETINPPFSEERHITADVALAQWQYYLATGDRAWLRWRAYPVLRETANYWVSRSHYNNSTGKFEIKRVTPPDEIAEIIDNSVYTNAAARKNLEVANEARRRLGRGCISSWRNTAHKMYLPFDAKNRRYIEFNGHAGQPTKQADTELLIYPLELPMARDVKENTFDYYKKKVMPKGPAMSSSVHSVIAARLGRRDEAYRLFQKSYRPYLRGPFNMFNEKPSKYLDNTCFLTGAGGTLQSVIYGFGGLRTSSEKLSATPILPKQWKRLIITGIKWRGKTYDLDVDPTGWRLRKVSHAIKNMNAPKINRRVSSQAKSAR
ncbi:MAG: glycosyl hydrolase family 65 protein [Armatimonadota bacterium]|nr:glycosyl hydrolase family 65 protein [Armatimonadota bacterium]